MPAPRTGTAVVLLVAAALTGCSSSSGSSASSPSPSGTSSSQAERLQLSGNDSFAFTPMMLEARAGHVVIAFHGKGSYPHNVAFPSLHKTSPSTSGGITGNDVELDLGTLGPGRYAFICQYHAGAGMKGVLVVS